MARMSAGLLIHRTRAGALEVLLVHPGGPFWAKKDDGAWSIPKGEYAEGEDPLAVAKRELEEETGLSVDGAFVKLEPIRQRSGKVVTAFAIEADVDASRITSNTFEMEWPPRSGRKQHFPEVDRAAWFAIGDARVKLLASQVPLLDQLTRAR
ncbi:MAG TPA: NUDIX domain-containing protein [Nevskiaceae bacterium]|nr:NUDIX domain-containing protein [Nevskiaceae bacterium]